MSVTRTAVPSNVTGPWPGPVAYVAEQRDLFFGRDEETETLTSLLHAYNLVLLHAPSGAGKSSLVNASVVPTLIDEGFKFFGRARVQPTRQLVDVNAEQPDIDGVIDLRSNSKRDANAEHPHDDGVIDLRSNSKRDANPYVQAVFTSLALDEEPGVGVEEHLIRAASDLDENGELYPCLVVLDQFEEILHICDNYSEHQQSFMEMVQRVVDVRPNLHFLFVTRDDHLGPILRLGRYLTNGFTAQLHIDQMTTEQASEVLVESAATFGAPLDELVAEQLVHAASIETFAVTGTDGQTSEPRTTRSPYVGLVALQVAARGLWNASGDGSRLDLDQLNALGGARGLIGQYYDRSVADVAKSSSDEAELRAFCEQRLISDAGQRLLVATSEVEAALGADAVVELSERAILRHAGTRYVELCHDSFIAPIQASNQTYRRQARTDAAMGRRNRNIAAAVGALLLIVATGLISSGVFRDQSSAVFNTIILSERVEPETLPLVPNVTGISQGDAIEALADVELAASLIEVRSDLPPGQVLHQQPDAGVRSTDAEVVLSVSAGLGILVRDETVIASPRTAKLIDVLQNDEAGVQGEPELSLLAVDAERGLSASITDGAIEILTQENGEFAVQYDVTDGSGQKATGTVTVVVEDLVAGIAVSSETTLVGDAVEFTDSSTGDLAERNWDFGDGTTSSEYAPTHTFTEPGQSTISLTVTDSSGATNTTTTVVDVITDTAPESPAEQEVVLLIDDANVRTSPRIADDTLAGKVEGGRGTTLQVDPQHADGWYRIVAGDQADNWIFGAFLFPPPQGFTTGVAMAEEVDLLNAAGDRIEFYRQGQFMLIADVVGTDYEILLANGTSALARQDDVAQIEEATDLSGVFGDVG